MGVSWGGGVRGGVRTGSRCRKDIDVGVTEDDKSEGPCGTGTNVLEAIECQGMLV